MAAGAKALQERGEPAHSRAASAPAYAMVEELNAHAKLHNSFSELHSSFVQKLAKAIKQEKSKLRRHRKLKTPEKKKPDTALIKELQQVGLHTSFVEQLAQRSQTIKLRNQQLSLQQRL